MNNQEVFEQYGSEKWVIEENLCYLLQEYVEELHNKGKSAVTKNRKYL